MVFFEYRSAGEIYLCVTERADLRNAIDWLEKQLAKMEKQGKEATTVMQFKEDDDR